MNYVSLRNVRKHRYSNYYSLFSTMYNFNYLVNITYYLFFYYITSNKHFYGTLYQLLEYFGTYLHWTNNTGTF